MVPLLAALVPVFGSLLDKLIPDTAEAAKAKAELELRLVEAANQAALAQVEVNKTEAASGSVFIGGWRPFIGWVCGAALALQFVVGPTIQWSVSAWVSTAAGQPVPPFPQLDSMLLELVFALLGIAGMRTWEKMRGVAR